MVVNKVKTIFILSILLALSGFVHAKGSLTKVKVLLDWTPNTNHTGIFVAKSLGYFKDEGLDVSINQPQDGNLLFVSQGVADFTVSFQEQITIARTANRPLPVVAIAAILAHNTSGYAMRSKYQPKKAQVSKLPISELKEKKYSWSGSQLDKNILKSILKKGNIGISDIKLIRDNASDFFAATASGNVDFLWIFYGWDVIAAINKGISLDYLPLVSVDKRMDFYTPVIATSEAMLQDKPVIVRKFLKALSKGYKYSIDNPIKAANILSKEVPELDPIFLQKSQQYLSSQYKADSPRWGQMEYKRWDDFAQFLFEHKIINKKLDAKRAFSNDYLPND